MDFGDLGITIDDPVERLLRQRDFIAPACVTGQRRR